MMEAVDLGYIYKVLIRHDNAMMSPSWFLDHLEVIDKSDNGRRFVFLCERWLSKSKDDKKIKRNLYEKSYEVRKDIVIHHSFTYSFTHSFIHSFIHSFNH